MSNVVENKEMAEKPEGYLEYIIKNIIKEVLFYAFVIFVIVFCMFPLVFAFVQSLIDPSSATNRMVWFPENPSWYNYSFITPGGHFDLTRAIINSFLLASVTTIACVAIGASASYSLAMFDFKIKNLILGLILSITMFPGIIIVLPLLIQYIFLRETFELSLQNSFLGILLPYIAFNLPLTVFLLYNFFQEIPRDLFKAAKVDGATNWQIFRRIIFPLALPGLFTTAILVFIASWNEFLFASILISLDESNTIPKEIAAFSGLPPPGITRYSPFLSLMAAATTVTIPLVFLVFMFQRQIISGLTQGAVKG